MTSQEIHPVNRVRFDEPGDIIVDSGFYEDRASMIQKFKELEQVDLPLRHMFQDGVYIREIFMPASTMIVGAIHRTKHYNIVISGKAEVNISGKVQLIQAGDVFMSDAGVSKVLHILEDMRWITIHSNPDNEESISKLENRLADLSTDFNQHELESKGDKCLNDFRMSLNNLIKN